MAPSAWPKVHVRRRVALLRADRVPAVAVLCNRVDLLSQGRGERGLGKHGVEADGLTAVPQGIHILIPGLDATPVHYLRYILYENRAIRRVMILHSCSPPAHLAHCCTRSLNMELLLVHVTP